MKINLPWVEVMVVVGSVVVFGAVVVVGAVFVVGAAVFLIFGVGPENYKFFY